MTKTTLFIAILAFVLASCGNVESSSEQESEKVIETSTPLQLAEVEDGFYHVIDMHEDSASLPNEYGPIIRYSTVMLDSNDQDQPDFIEIDTIDFVPLTLKHAPDSAIQQDQRINLLLTLTDSAGINLEEFTGKFVNERVTIVIGGEAMTVHVIREKITGGKMQITRCTDNACEKLFYELQDNVTE